MDKIISIVRYRCGVEEMDHSQLFLNNTEGKVLHPVNVFLLEHKKQGMMLLNTGLSRRVQHNPVLYARYTARHKVSFRPEDVITRQLEAQGMDPMCIRKVLLTHGAPDCCGALPLLTRFELISTAQVLGVLWAADPADEVMKSTLPPEEIPRRAAGLYKGNGFLKEYFKWIFDVFGDGSVLAVDLSGAHTAMAGYYLPEKKIFFAAEAAPDMETLRRGEEPSYKMLRLQKYPEHYLKVQKTLLRLMEEHPDVQICCSRQETLPNGIEEASERKDILT